MKTVKAYLATVLLGGALGVFFSLVADRLTLVSFDTIAAEADIIAVLPVYDDSSTKAERELARGRIIKTVKRSHQARELLGPVLSDRELDDLDKKLKRWLKSPAASVFNDLEEVPENISLSIRSGHYNTFVANENLDQRPGPPSAEAAATKPSTPGKSPTELQLDEIYAKAPTSKAEIDALADSIAQETGGRVAKAPLKNRDRALEKAIKDYGGDASKVKDIARNTIVVEQNQYDKVVALLKEQEAKVTSIDPASDPMGYSGTISVIKTKAGIPAEIQVNTPEMIFAKELPANARAILGKEKYSQLAAETGVPGGGGHPLYKEWRSLPPGDPRRDQLAAESRAYYDHIRRTGGQCGHFQRAFSAG